MSQARYNVLARRPRQIAILRALKLGDLLCVIPAVRALKAASPTSQITLVGLPWAREFVERYPHYFNDFIEFPGWPGLPEREFNPGAVAAFLTQMQARRFDVLIQCHGSGSHVNDIAELAGAAALAGFYDQFPPRGAEHAFIPYPKDEPEVWRCLRLASAIGGSFAGEGLEFPLREKDFFELAALLPGFRRYPPFAVVHPGAATNGDRLWPLERFAVVIDGLMRRGLQIVFTGGAHESARIAMLRSMIPEETRDLSGKTSLGVLGALLSQSRLILCHDTGVSHLAAALEVPSVVLFDRSDREGWPPANRQLHRFVTGFDGVSPTDVLAEVDNLLMYSERMRSTREARVVGEEGRSCEAA